MERKTLNMDESIAEIIVNLSEGNPGAATVLLKLIQVDPFIIFRLDDMNIRGAQIWFGYKDCCHENLELFMKLLQEMNQQLVDGINICSARYGVKAKAIVQHSEHPKDEVLSEEDKKKLKTMEMPDLSQYLKASSKAESTKGL